VVYLSIDETGNPYMGTAFDVTVGMRIDYNDELGVAQTQIVGE
jgi:hypothetical protein